MFLRKKKIDKLINVARLERTKVATKWRTNIFNGKQKNSLVYLSQISNLFARFYKFSPKRQVESNVQLLVSTKTTGHSCGTKLPYCRARHALAEEKTNKGNEHF